MNINIRKSKERGYANHGWLETYHTFSFADYYDPENMGFSVLRVINEDFVEGGRGFATHGHRDMEIITYIIEGALEHKDSMGNTAIIKPGEVQRMSAGTGVRHSESNPLQNVRTHLLQIWILPDYNGHTPSYGQTSFAEQLEKSQFVLVASQNGDSGSVNLNQDIRLYAGRFQKQKSEILKVVAGRSVWVQVLRGQVKISDGSQPGTGAATLVAGDGAAIADAPSSLKFDIEPNTELLVFDLPRH